MAKQKSVLIKNDMTTATTKKKTINQQVFDVVEEVRTIPCHHQQAVPVIGLLLTNFSNMDNREDSIFYCCFLVQLCEICSVRQSQIQVFLFRTVATVTTKQTKMR